MLNVLETIYSLPFFLGALAGTVLWKLYCHMKRSYEDRRHPLPDGAKHAVAHMSRQWIAGLAAILSLGYVLLVTGRTEARTVVLNEAVNRCWSETYQQIKTQVMINAQNDGISRQYQALQREYDDNTSSWLKDLVTPPNGLAGLPIDNPDRQAFVTHRTAEYQGQIDELSKRFDDLANQRTGLDADRNAHPLPEERCGR